MIDESADLPLEVDLVSGAAPDVGVRLKLDVNDVLSFADETNTLVVCGGRGDSIDAGAGWTAAGQDTVEGAVFNVYTQGSAVLMVDVDVDQSSIGLL